MQPGKRHEFVPRRLNDRDFFRSLYRLDGHDPWNGFLAGHRQPPNPNDGRDDPSSQTKCKYEYLEKLITVTKYYSVPVTKRQLDGDGVMQTTTKKSFFQILNVFNAHSRPKLVPAWDDAENVVKQYGMSVTAHHLAMSESIMEAFPCNDYQRRLILIIFFYFIFGLFCFFAVFVSFNFIFELNANS